MEIIISLWKLLLTYGNYFLPMEIIIYVWISCTVTGIIIYLWKLLSRKLLFTYGNHYLGNYYLPVDLLHRHWRYHITIYLWKLLSPYGNYYVPVELLHRHWRYHAREQPISSLCTVTYNKVVKLVIKLVVKLVVKIVSAPFASTTVVLSF